MKEFFAMGGYGAYVWSSYALAAIALVGNWLAAVRRQRAVIRRLARRQQA